MAPIRHVVFNSDIFMVGAATSGMVFFHLSAFW